MINTISELFPHIGIKINTLVTSHNTENILGISDILSPFSNQIICWKLFQVSTRGVVNESEESDLVDNDVFKDLFERAKRSTLKFHIHALPVDAPTDYCMIRCDGTMITIDKDGYREITSINDLPFSNNDFSKTSLGYESDQ